MRRAHTPPQAYEHASELICRFATDEGGEVVRRAQAAARRAAYDAPPPPISHSHFSWL